MIYFGGRDWIETFEELAELFSEQDNQVMIREMLVKVKKQV